MPIVRRATWTAATARCLPRVEVLANDDAHNMYSIVIVPGVLVFAERNTAGEARGCLCCVSCGFGQHNLQFLSSTNRLWIVFQAVFTMSKVSKGRKANNKSGQADKDVTPPLPPNWDRCHAYNHLRRRYCRQMPLRSSVNDANHNQPKYCGNHAHLLEEWLSIQGHNLVGAAHGEDENDEHSRKIPRISNHPNNSVGNRKKNRGKRVPCPVDPTHLIFEGSISKHVLVCPAAKRKQEVVGKEYYCEGINLGGFGDMGRVTESMICDLAETKKLAYSVLQVFSQLFLATCEDNIGMLSTQQLQNITESEIYDSLPETDLSGIEEEIHYDTMPFMSSSTAARSRDHEANPNLDEVEAKPGRLSLAITKHRIRAGGPRHLRQIASILGHVRREGLIAEKNAESEKESLVVEMGAGRGMTGLVVAGAMGASMQSENAKVQLCLVERAGTRGKAESRVRMSKGTQLKDDCLRLDLVDVTRVRCDLAHVDITKALGAQKDFSKTVVIAKHLCGAGTDLALKSIRNLASIDGCIFATCCHGLCNWNDYVGRDCLLSSFCSKTSGLTSFGESQFNLMKRWASASVERRSPNSNSPSSDDDQTEDDHPTFPDDDNDDEGKASNIFAVVGELGLACGGKGLGRVCQRLIDYGRCDYMRKALLASEDHSSSGGGTYNVRLLHYVPRDVTPQNALIIATRE